MRICLAVLAFVTLAFDLSAKPYSSATLDKIGTGDVTNYYNKEVIVTGTVAQVSIRPKITFLNMDKPYPDSPFTLVILSAATNQFSDIKALRGMSVEATGVITNYHGRAEIVLEKSNQLEVVGPAPTNAAPAP